PLFPYTTLFRSFICGAIVTKVVTRCQMQLFIQKVILIVHACTFMCGMTDDLVVLAYAAGIAAIPHVVPVAGEGEAFRPVELCSEHIGVKKILRTCAGVGIPEYSVSGLLF